MSSVFLVESGSHEDYTLHAIFTIRVWADDFAAWLNGPPDPDGLSSSDAHQVREMLVDPPLPKTGRFIVEDTPEELLGPEEQRIRWDPDETGKSEAQSLDDGAWVIGRGKTRAAALASARRLARKAVR